MDSKITLWLWGIGTSIIGAFFYVFTWYRERQVFQDMPIIGEQTTEFSILVLLGYMIMFLLVGLYIGKRFMSIKLNF